MCAPRAPLVEARAQGLHVLIARWVAAVTGFLGLEVLGGVGRGVVKHWSAHVAIVGSVVSMHGAVETMRGCFNSPLGAGVGSSGGHRRSAGAPLVQLAGQGTLIFVPDGAMLRLFVGAGSDGVCLRLFLLTFGIVTLAVAGAFIAFAAVTLALTALLSLVCCVCAVCCDESFATARWCAGRQGRVLVR